MDRQTMASEENKTTTQLQTFISLPGEIKTSSRRMVSRRMVCGGFIALVRLFHDELDV